MNLHISLLLLHLFCSTVSAISQTIKSVIILLLLMLLMCFSRCAKCHSCCECQNVAAESMQNNVLKFFISKEDCPILYRQQRSFVLVAHQCLMYESHAVIASAVIIDCCYMYGVHAYFQSLRCGFRLVRHRYIPQAHATILYTNRRIEFSYAIYSIYTA